MAERIVIDFDEQGNPTLDVLGAVGKSCRVLTREFEQALGARVSERLKPEFRQRDQRQQRRAVQ